MPNIKSAIKRVKVSKTKSDNNTVKKSALKSTLKKCKEGIEKKDDSSKEALKNAVIALDKAAASKIIHKNKAARKKSRLTKAMNSDK